MAEQDLELFLLHRAEQSKYVYFILAAAAGGIALAVRMTADATLHWSLAPLGAAVLSWGLSFFHGCRQLQYTQGITRANAEMLKAGRGEAPYGGPEPWKREVGVQALKEIIDRDIDAASRDYNRQFRYLVTGAVLFVGWHILRIVLRSTASTP
jgi:hypothetical protein